MFIYIFEHNDLVLQSRVVFFNQIGSLFADHDTSCVCISRDRIGHSETEKHVNQMSEKNIESNFSV